MPSGKSICFLRFCPMGSISSISACSGLRPNDRAFTFADLDAPSSDAGKRLLTTFFSAAFVASVDSRPALIVFARDGALFAQRFDEERFALLGDPHRLADNIGWYPQCGVHFRGVAEHAGLSVARSAIPADVVRPWWSGTWACRLPAGTGWIRTGLASHATAAGL